MKTILIWCLVVVPNLLMSQEIVEIPIDSQPEGVEWDREESSYFNNVWQTQTVANVSSPSMEVFRPSPEKNTGAAVVICPGGGMYLLSIESEGKSTCQANPAPFTWWAQARGIRT